MNIVSLFRSNRSRRLDEAEEVLGRPDPSEGEDLAMHVSKCAQRWAVLYRQNLELGDRLDGLKAFLIILILVAIINAGSNVWTTAITAAVLK